MDELYDFIKEDYGTEPCILKCDLSYLDEEKAQGIAKIIVKHYKCLDGIIFNAAILEKMSNIESFDLKTWQKIIATTPTANNLPSRSLA